MRRAKFPSSSKALVGMHPQFKHVPPSVSFSMHSTRFLSCPARMAAAYPAGPPPITTMSKLYAAIEVSDDRKTAGSCHAVHNRGLWRSAKLLRDLANRIECAFQMTQQ